MIWILILIFCFILGVFMYNRKYNSPYKLICLFGRKGSGKTTTEARLAMKYVKRGYHIYTDIDGFKLPGSTIFSLAELKVAYPAPKSCVLLDEVGLSMSNRDFKSFDKGLREFFKLQRHAECVVIVNSQGFDMDKSVRILCDEFYFVRRIGPLTLLQPIIQTQKPNDMQSGTNDSPVVESYKWGSIFSWRFTWIPRYAHMFDSFALPPRERIVGTVVPGDAPDSPKSARAWLRALNKQARRGR